MNARQRAEPLSRDERRIAILDAVIPLLLDRGASVTTSQIAEAAGIAEGTIFRVFPDKSTLLHEAVKASFDPEPDIRRITEIEEAADLEERFTRAASILEERFDRLHQLMGVIRALGHISDDKRSDGKRAAQAANSATIAALTELFSIVEDELTVSPQRAAAMLNSLMFAIHIPFTSRNNRVSADEAVSMLLHGICQK